ncbi:TetR/AcrR family transcriptional regulator [Conexibacter sp. SYSU D00693]|uniref:TetR/AcrR family transcriptional regulator n=1 Tax=Conexibacter sp. SYSU D00693 TaxID=2812560 RepID=UPI00196A57AC|nr:TetR/AcrR family transcriptional regulator [Conexibacter sp. SYSU D00693]
MSSTLGSEPVRATRPGGRSARVRAAVHRAVQELLAEGGVEAATVPAVAARAGVAPTTVYRRWRSAPELLADVAVSRLTGGLVVPDTGSLAEDLRRWAHAVRTDLSDPDSLTLLRTLLGSAALGSPACTACLEDRRTQLAAMVERERERGGEAPDAEVLLETLLGPVYFRALFDEGPMDPQHLDALVDRVLRT